MAWLGQSANAGLTWLGQFTFAYGGAYFPWAFATGEFLVGTPLGVGTSGFTITLVLTGRDYETAAIVGMNLFLSTPSNPGKGGGGAKAGVALRSAVEAASGGAGPVAVGKQGLQVAGITQNTTRIPSLRGTATYRIPDGLNHATRVIFEVKNVAKLCYTNQLRDYVLWAQANGYRFELWIRPTTSLSTSLQQAINDGHIVLRYLP